MVRSFEQYPLRPNWSRVGTNEFRGARDEALQRCMQELSVRGARPSAFAARRSAASARRRSGRFRSSTTGDSISITVALLDGNAHNVSLYLLDWDRFRVFDVELFDALEGSLLDARSIRSASEGVYYSWVAQGRIRFQLNRLAGNAVLSGLFIDPLVVSTRRPRLIARQLNLSALSSIQLDLRGVPNYPYRVEVSGDLEHWAPWQVRIASPSGRISIVDSFDTDFSARFYRAVLHY